MLPPHAVEARDGGYFRPLSPSYFGRVAVRKINPGTTEANPALRDLVVRQVHVSSLKPYANNPRTHTKKQIRQIAESIRTFGWTNPVLIDANDRIIAGHGRVEAAKLLGMPTVPVLRIEDLSEAQLKAYVIADNKLAELAGWDEQILAKELQLLTELNLDFDIEVTGFEMGEIDVLIGGQSGSPDPADNVPEIDEAKTLVSLLGDVWLLGPHRLACGDALSIQSYGLLMGRHRAQMVFTDPPYNVSIKGILAANGRVKHPEFVMASGENVLGGVYRISCPRP
jgi:ParB/Sulfiredoxin domain